MSRGTPGPGRGQPGGQQDAPDGGAVEIDPLALPEQLREVAVVGSRVARARQLHDPLGESHGEGMPGTPVPVAVDQGSRSIAPVPGQHAIYLPLRDIEHARDLGHREPTPEVLVEDAGTTLLAGTEVDGVVVHDRQNPGPQRA